MQLKIGSLRLTFDAEILHCCCRFCYQIHASMWECDIHGRVVRSKLTEEPKGSLKVRAALARLWRKS